MNPNQIPDYRRKTQDEETIFYAKMGVLFGEIVHQACNINPKMEEFDLSRQSLEALGELCRIIGTDLINLLGGFATEKQN